jgi:general secretion pathway protein D
LREGEASILGGIQDKQDEVSWTGIPGLSSIPILKYLFGSKDHTISDDELVFLVVPHVVRTQSIEPVNLRTIDTGVGTSIELRHVPSEGPGSNSAPPNTRPVLPPPTAHPAVGTVPGESAMEAAPAALAQMSASADVNGNTAAAAVGGSPLAPYNPPNTGGVSLALNSPPGPIAVGATFQVPVVLMGGKDIASVPLQVQYDPAKLSVVSVTEGDFLGRDGQAPGLSHRDDGQGLIFINTSRPPGTAGVSGAGVVCVLSFKAKAAGQSVLNITHPGVINSAQMPVTASSSQISIVVK